MIPLPPIQWLRAPANRTIIERWTRNAASGHRLHLPDRAATGSCAFLVVGDTGDSEVTGSRRSPQVAIAESMALEAGLAFSAPAVETTLPPAPSPARTPAEFILHTGDVVYMSGERRLYDRNFRRPYEAFLTRDSTYANLVFRLPFLPVPGNHDYYDFLGVAAALVRLPLLGTGLRTIARELFDFSLPQGGSEMGRAFMDAFVAQDGDDAAYRPGERTRIPNRYYQFRLGPLDVFALDSNTLDAPAPAAGAREERAEARRALNELRSRLIRLDDELLSAERQVEGQRREARLGLAADEARRGAAENATAEVMRVLRRLGKELGTGAGSEWRKARKAARAARAAWGRGLAGLRRSRTPSSFARAFERVDRAVESLRHALDETDRLLLRLSTGASRARLLEIRDALERSFQVWCETTAYEPSAGLREEVERLRDEVLAVQRGAARESRRARFSAADHDAAQLRWLDEGLAASVGGRPQAWRVVYLHHPLWTTGTAYCENDEVQSIRENLIEILRGRVHLLIAGHSHAFEWVRTSRLPETAVIVSGGGGQVNLARSVLDPARIERHREGLAKLLSAGVEEAAFAGRGPGGPDGATGPLHHYLRIEAGVEMLRVRPIGVRRLGNEYRLERPLPVHHATGLGPSGCGWTARLLEAIELKRGHPALARWA